MTEAERLNEFSKLMETACLTIPFVDWLVQTGFFSAPASLEGAGAYAGGLYDHGKATIIQLNKWNMTWQRPASPYLIGMFHDLCKMDETKEVIDDEGVTFFGEDVARDVESHFEAVTPPLPGHGEKSIMLLSRFMTLTEEEIYCIRYHMGLAVPDEQEAFTAACKRFPNVLFTHTAQFYATNVQEL